MNGNNTQTKEGFINALGHPRKKELAELLLTEGVTVEQVAAIGVNRVTALEMAREIRQSIQGMEEFSFEWPRDEKVEVAKIETKNETEENTDTANADQGVVATDENQTAPVATDDTAVKTEETVNDSAPVSSETVPTPTADTVAPTEETPAAPEEPKTDTPAAPAAPQA